MMYAIVLLASAVGCVLNTVCGFGFGVMGMIVMPYAMGSTVHAASVINMATFVQATFLAVRYRKHIRWKLLAVPPAMRPLRVLALSFTCFAAKMK